MPMFATLSLALLEPAALALDQHVPAARVLVNKVRALWDQDLSDEDWVNRFLQAVGSGPDRLPPEMIAGIMPLVPVLRRRRPVWHNELPLTEFGGGHISEACRIRWTQRGV